MIWRRKLIRFLLLPIGIIGVPVIMLVVPLSYTLDTSVPFSYVPPPEGDADYYIGTTVKAITSTFIGGYVSPFDAERYNGQSFIFKNIEIAHSEIVTREIQLYILGKGLADTETETFLMSGNVQFVPQDLSKWQELKAGDIVDIICVCAGISKEYAVVVITNCQFLPAGLAPLPLPGGPAIVAGY